MYTHDLIETQRNFERMNAALGHARYLAAQDEKAKAEGFDKRDDVQKMIRGALPILSAAIAAWIEEASTKKGRPPAALAPLKALTVRDPETKTDRPDTDKVALIALSRTFQTIARKLPIAATAINIGRFLQAEIEAASATAKDAKAASKYLKLIESSAKENRTAKTHAAILEGLQLGLQWSQRTQLLVGGVILNVLLESLTGVFERGTMPDTKGELPIVRLTDEALDALSGMADALGWARPVLRPMIAPPRPWTRTDTGAYFELSISKVVPLVRTYSREHLKLLRESIKDGTMQPCLDALNAIQETRFAIDRRVLEVEKWVRDEGHQPSSSFPLAPSAVPELGKKMDKAEWEAMPIEARIAKTRERITKRNIKAAAGVNGTVFNTDIREAERLACEEAFFLPHSMDTRGRIYAVPHFNPQRSDHVKALFRFADAVPMGRDGGFWLAVHLANCGDFPVPSGKKASKSTFPERVQWVDDNEAMILACARDPKATYETWSAADSPFCFLQACFEYAEYAASGYSPDFPGTIGIALDGSCSGLQHYSAMNRAEKEAHHVNLLPRDTVGDIYQVVADAALPGIEGLALGGNIIAKTVIANGFGRSTVKRNVMTYFYGSGKFGMRDQHMEDTMRPKADEVALGKLKAHPYAILTDRTDKETGEVTQALDGGFSCAQLMASATHGAVVSVAPKADKAASWFQGVAAILAHESLPVIWRTPMGMPVVQRYSEYTSKVVNLWLYDRKVTVPQATSTDKVEGEKVLTRIQTLIREAPTKRIDKKKARSAIAPNVVHSLDAAHLQRVALKGKEEGIAHFLFIHDSFATHAGNTERFSLLIREAFVEQYETYCPFEALETYARSVLSEEGIGKLEALEKPARGALDLADVLKAKYAFA